VRQKVPEPVSQANADLLYEEVAADYGAALDRLARAYEADPDKRRDLLQDIHLALWRSLEYSPSAARYEPGYTLWRTIPPLRMR
jgi:DNA-directed RNA polymerase specialized sigma24 family protein